eukprot:CAMPEP_0172632368 /NCGR_PEP_ID=MMETSP1068-20121228/184090_1 /TAXON_ID=35684 /ORGANISM="Pseudopedinella elastica, Strain CCMP716" /LENGTH=57 /DNA_ID=CAMNT_0013443743 /DNA_START=32 /DNA_END=201 /DNA_ORIENTATION=+
MAAQGPGPLGGNYARGGPGFAHQANQAQANQAPPEAPAYQSGRLPPPSPGVAPAHAA